MNFNAIQPVSPEDWFDPELPSMLPFVITETFSVPL